MASNDTGINDINTVIINTNTDDKAIIDSGFVSVQFLFILMFISTLIMGIAVYSYSYIQTTARALRKNMVYREIEGIVRDIIADMYADPSPDINSFEDPFWTWNGKSLNDYRIVIIPLSDRLNLNYVRKNIFEKTNAGMWLNPGRTAAELQQFREDNGMSLSTGFYNFFFDKEIMQKFFSCYGWANINLIDEFSAEKLALSLTGSEQTAEQIRRIVQTLLINQQPAGRTTMHTLFGIHYDEVFPFINTESLINVNYAEPALLRILISYPDYGVKYPDARCDELLVRRSVAGLGTDEIFNILGIDSANPLAFYLGSITWFWEITITNERDTYRVVICRLPPDDKFQTSRPFGQSEEIAFTIIEQGFQ
jgi:hypothetical protein